MELRTLPDRNPSYGSHMTAFGTELGRELARAHQQDLYRLAAPVREAARARRARREAGAGRAGTRAVRRRLGWSLVALGLRLAVAGPAGELAPPDWRLAMLDRLLGR